MIPNSMGPVGLALLKSYEQCRLNAYFPTPNDVPTIGWGCTRNLDGSPVKIGQVVTLEEAGLLLHHRLRQTEAAITSATAGVQTTQFQFDAMASLAFNIGEHAFEQSTVIKRHRTGDYPGAAVAFALWDKQGAKVLLGLVRRRAAEAALYRRAA